MKAVVILSGGMDSTTLLYDVLSGRLGEYDISVLSFDYGQRHFKELIKACSTTTNLSLPHKVVDVKSLQDILQGSSLTSHDIETPHGHYEEENMKLTVVPNRNMIMLSIAIGYAVSIGAEIVFYGAHGGDHAIYPDCRPEFVQAMNIPAAIANEQSVIIDAPYLEWDKGDIAIRGKELDVPYEDTWTCYDPQPDGKACGLCGSCQERLEAFEKAGMEDPLEYANG